MALPKGNNNVSSKKPGLATSVASRNGDGPMHTAYKYENGERKIVDPVVARLKEARRLEKEKKEQEARAKKGLLPKPANKPKSTIPLRTGPSVKAVQDRKQPGAAASRKPGKASTTTPPPPPIAARPKPKKLKFNELMKKASGIDQSKLSITIKAKSSSPETGKPEEKALAKSQLSQPPKMPSKPQGAARVATSKVSRPIERRPVDSRMDRRPVEKKPMVKEVVRAPLPTRGPSSQLAQKLKAKPKASAGSRHEDEYEDDLDDFIASDEEEEVDAADYNRDEIWALFNRGKKRSDYQFDDYDSDDMEATGAEIFDEELRSKKRAELEDRKEWEEEQRRAALKRQRKLGKR